MLPPGQAAAAFVARLASVGVAVSRPELLADGLAGFLAAERAAVRERCAALVPVVKRDSESVAETLRLDCLEHAIRQLPLD